MKRRDLLLAVLTSCALWPLITGAQNAPRVVGVLRATIPRGPDILEKMRQSMAEAGLREGQDFVFEYRQAEGQYERLPSFAGELVHHGAAVIVAPNLPSALAAKAATATIPIVFMMGDDPVKQGLVASLNRPGGNATGLNMLTAGLDAKRLQVLHDLVPNSDSFGLLVNPTNPNSDAQASDVRAAANAIGREIQVSQAQNDRDIETAFAAMAKRRVGGVVVGADPFFSSRVRPIVELAERYRLPAIYEWREFADAGGLASYGSSWANNYRELGVYVGRILKGAKPADLPVLQPTKFELVINLRTAKALGLAVTPVLLAQADEVIE